MRRFKIRYKLSRLFSCCLLAIGTMVQHKCTVGDEEVKARNTDFTCMSIFSKVFGLPAPILLTATHCT